jgi:dienelactone hydrolase
MKFLKLIVACGFMMAAARSVASAQTVTSPLWADLKPGPYRVGFRSYWTRDRSRSWRAALGPDGTRLPIDPARPIRINIWYPATSDRSGAAMLFRDYLGSARTAGFEEDEKRVRTDDLGSFGSGGIRGLMASDSSFNRLMQTPMVARRDARMLSGKFPVVFYSLGQGDYTQENIPLCEYLASRGYIVLSVPQLGTSPRRSVMFIHDPPSYDGQVRDLAFALGSVLSDFPSADRGKIGAVGMSMGGVYALLLAVRYLGAIQSVVGLDPSFMDSQPPYVYKYWEAPEFDPARFRGNLLALYKGGDQPRPPIVDSLRYSNRTLVRVPRAVHADFNAYPVYTARAQSAELDTFALARRSRRDALRTFVSVSRYVACYLDSTLARRAKNFVSCDEIPDASTERLAAASTPTEEELYDLLHSSGNQSALAALDRARLSGASLPLRKSVMIRIANELGYANHLRESAEYADLAATAFPDAEMYERAGDAWANAGDKSRALAEYRHAETLEPGRASLKPKIAGVVDR